MFTEKANSYLLHMVPLRKDNYAYILELPKKQAVMIDSTLKEGTLEFLEQQGLKPIALLLTHHHYDHADELSFFQDTYNCQIFCSSYDSKRPEVQGQHTIVKDQEQIEIAGLTFKVLETPGHTRSHLSYFLEDQNTLFCGDTLFSLGCGRIFEPYENVFEDFHNSFQKIQKTCNEETKVYCAHEYTLANLNFLKSQNLINSELEGIIKRRLADENKTVPTSIGFELKHNSFFNSRTVDEFRKLRQKKDKF